MKKYVGVTILLIGFLFGLTGCQKDEFTAQILPPATNIPSDSLSRTILVYMAAKNNLWPYHDENIKRMKEGLSVADLKNSNILIYSSGYTPNPRLLKMVNTPNGIDTVSVVNYTTQNAVQKETLQKVISDVRRLFPAQENGLILWSHGMNWFPEKYTYNDGADFSAEAPDEDTLIGSYSFGVEDNRSMELADLRDALPDGGFKFIMFDACYMGSVEVAYALRQKANYLIASPAEIYKLGFPYHLIMPHLTTTPMDLEGVCREFYEFYDAKTGLMRSATISLIDLSQMEPLSDIVKSIYSECSEQMEKEGWHSVQWFDRGYYHAMFDLGDYVERITSGDNRFTQFKAQLGKTILYAKNTPWLFLGDAAGNVQINKYSGISVYIWQRQHATLNRTYQTLDWYKKVFSN